MLHIDSKTPHNSSGVQRWIDTKNISDITIIPTQSQQSEISNSESIYSVIVFETQSISNENAKQNELTSWKDNHVDESIQNKNQFCSSLHWVC